MDVTDVLGDFGTAQKRVLALAVYRSIALTSVAYITHLSTLNVDHWCSPETNVSVEEWKECCVPKETKGYSKCYQYELSDNYTVFNSSKVPCSSWQYADNRQHYSIVSDFELVCDSRWQVPLLYTLFSTGNFVAYGPSGYFADKIGRKPCVVFGVIVTTICTIISPFSTSVIMFAVLRFISGIGYPFIQHELLSIYMEMSGKRARSLAQFAFSGSWGLGVTIMASISLAVPNWKTLIFVTSVPIQIIFLALSVFALPESPRWLLASRKYDKAETEIKKLAAVNGIIIVDPKSVMEDLKVKIEMHDDPNKSKKHGDMVSFLEFFKTRRLFIISTTLMFINCAKAFLGSGFNISLRHFGGVVQINYIVHGLTGALSSLVFEATRAVLKLRRVTLVSCYLLSGAMFVVIIFISDELHWLKLSLAMTGNIFKKVASVSLYLVTTEVYPTNIRGKGTALYMACGRIGNMLAPATDLLAYEYGNNAPLILFAGICALISVLISILPETEKYYLPDSVPEANQIIAAKTEEETK